MRKYLGALLFMAACIFATGCVAEPTNRANSNANVASLPTPAATTSPTPLSDNGSNTQSLTFPVLDAFLANESSSSLLKSRLQLTDDQIATLKQAAHSEPAKLSEANAGTSVGETASARIAAKEKITTLIGPEKEQQLEALIAEQWSSDNESATEKTATQPALNDGKVPDEPWVAKMKNVSAGERVEAGSKLNPLGPIKIPIGGPSLIHGGKPPAKLGTFASHGCVGLTTPQVEDFAKILAQLGGAHLTDTDIAAYARDKTETKEVKLAKAVPVELRYETIVVEDGKLHIYRDVYDQDANTEENLKVVLEANGVRLDDLTEEERTQTLNALAQMSGASTTPAPPQATRTTGTNRNASSSPMPTERKSTANKATPRATKNQKEIVIEIAALKGKGYPAPVDLDTGVGQKKRRS